MIPLHHMSAMMNWANNYGFHLEQVVFFFFLLCECVPLIVDGGMCRKGCGWDSKIVPKTHTPFVAGFGQYEMLESVIFPLFCCVSYLLNKNIKRKTKIKTESLQLIILLTIRNYLVHQTSHITPLGR